MGPCLGVGDVSEFYSTRIVVSYAGECKQWTAECLVSERTEGLSTQKSLFSLCHTGQAADPLEISVHTISQLMW